MIEYKHKTLIRITVTGTEEDLSLYWQKLNEAGLRPDTSLDVNPYRMHRGLWEPEDAMEVLKLLEEIQLNQNHEGWCHTPVICHQCNHQWVAVHPETAEYLECPNCKIMVDL